MRTQLSIRWVLLCLVTVLLLSLAPPSVTRPYTQSAKHLAFVGGMLLTGYEVPPIHHAAIVVEGDRIVQAGPYRR
jgi:hypothetical protein